MSRRALRLLWNLVGQKQDIEKVASFEKAIARVLEREEKEGRRLRDWEYDLAVYIPQPGGGMATRLWRNDQYMTFAAFVEKARGERARDDGPKEEKLKRGRRKK